MRSQNKNTTVANLKDAIEKRLDRMIQQNPLRTDFQEHYEKIIAEYNSEKDRATIEKTFEELMKLHRRKRFRKKYNTVQDHNNIQGF